MEKITKENFDQVISNGKVLVDFSAKWCGPCRMLQPVLEELSSDRNVKIYSVDIDDDMDLATSFGIMSVPTMILFDNGTEISKHTGFMPKEQLENWIHNS